MKILIIACVAALCAGGYGGWMLNKALDQEVVQPVEALPGSVDIDAGKFLIHLPNTTDDAPHVVSVTLVVDPQSAPEKLSEIRTVIHELLEGAIEMPLVSASDDIIERLSWALPHSASRSAPWILDAQVRRLRDERPTPLPKPEPDPL